VSGVGWLRALGARSGGTRRAAVGLAPRLPGRTVPRGAVGKANATSSRRAPPGQARALMCAPAIVLTTARPSGAPPREAFFGNYGLVVVDQCHHLPAISFEKDVGPTCDRPSLSLGLTATHRYRQDGPQEINIAPISAHSMARKGPAKRGRVRGSLPFARASRRLWCRLWRSAVCLQERVGQPVAE